MILLDDREANIQIPHVLAVCVMHWPGFLLFAMSFVFQGAEWSCFKKKMVVHVSFPEYSKS